MENLLETSNFVVGYLDNEGQYCVLKGDMDFKEFLALKSMVEVELFNTALEYYLEGDE